MLLQLVPRSHELALAVLPRAVDIGAWAVVAEVRLERVSRHELVAVGVVGADHGQLVQNVPHESRGTSDVGVSVQRMPVGGTSLLHPHVRTKTKLAEGMGAWRVHRVDQRLPTHLAEQVLIYVVGIVVEMVLSRLVALSADVAHHNVPHPLDLEAAHLPETDAPGRLGASRLCCRHFDSATTKIQL